MRIYKRQINIINRSNWSALLSIQKPTECYWGLDQEESGCQEIADDQREKSDVELLSQKLPLQQKSANV